MSSILTRQHSSHSTSGKACLLLIFGKAHQHQSDNQQTEFHNRSLHSPRALQNYPPSQITHLQISHHLTALHQQKSSLRTRSSYAGSNNNSDDQTASTQSAMTPSQSGTARIHDLESQMKHLHQEIKLDSTATNSRFSDIDVHLAKSMDCH